MSNPGVHGRIRSGTVTALLRAEYIRTCRAGKGKDRWTLEEASEITGRTVAELEKIFSPVKRGAHQWDEPRFQKILAYHPSMRMIFMDDTHRTEGILNRPGVKRNRQGDPASYTSPALPPFPARTSTDI